MFTVHPPTAQLHPRDEVPMTAKINFGYRSPTRRGSHTSSQASFVQARLGQTKLWALAKQKDRRKSRRPLFTES
jgi:hypothetical protein